MKTSIKIITAAVLLICLACGARKNAQTPMETDQQAMVSNDNSGSQANTAPENSANGGQNMDDSNNSGQANENSTSASSNVNAGITTPSNKMVTDNSQMYTELKMTDDQIQSFEKAMEEFTSRKNNTANGEMMGTEADEEDRQLETILLPEQYPAYQTWKIDN